MSLIPSHIKSLRPYVPGRTIEEIKKEFNLEKVYKLASNENPLGPSPHAVEAMIKCMEDVHRYQDVGAIELRTLIANKYDLHIDNVAVGSGSEGIISYILRCFLQDDDELLSSAGTFIGFQVLAKSSGKKYVEVPMKEGYKFDLNAIYNAINEKTKIIYLCNPNNPTGTIFTKDEFEKFVDKIPEDVIVILDEAYFEFANDKPEYPDSLHHRHDNVITLRTFSKVYGIAAVRIGYGFGQKDFIESIMKVKMPFEPSLPAQVGAIASIKDSDFLARSLQVNKEGYNLLTGEFDKLKLNWIPSYANFIMIDFGSEEKVAHINESMLRDGIIIRPLKPFGLGHCLRITVGLEEENIAMLNSLKKYV